MLRFAFFVIFTFANTIGANVAAYACARGLAIHYPNSHFLALLAMLALVLFAASLLSLHQAEHALTSYRLTRRARRVVSRARCPQ
jgi:hypothetical protein